MIVAAFATEAELARALDRIGEGFGPVETYTPAMLQGEREEGERARSILPRLILLAGLAGAGASAATLCYSAAVAYPFRSGGRPYLAWPSFVPTVFENAVLAALAAGFLGVIAINRLPRLHDPVDEAEAMRRATSDRWVLALRRPTDPAGARAALRALAPARLDELP